MAKLSVVISAFNEEKNIGDCLESVKKLADEIIVVNNSSTDKTEEIAQEYTPKIFRRQNFLMLNINKNFGFSKATGEWILSLDADERVTPELREEILKGIRNQVRQPAEGISGYYLPRKNIIFGKWMRHTGWYPDHQLRLFKKGKGKFPQKHVHEMIEVDGEVDYLKEHILHLNYTTIAQFLYKLSQIYTPNEAQNILDSGKKVVWHDALRMPAQEFFRRFFAQEGWRDGLHGLVLSLLMAFYHLVVFAQVWENQGFGEFEEKNFLAKVGQEFKSAKKDLNYWLGESQISRTSNPLKKLILKLRRRFWR